MTDAITITIDDAAVRRLFVRLRDAAANPAPLLRGIGMEMETRTAERFESRRDPSGAPWAKLSPRTVRRKKGRGSLLVFTGEMLDSLNHRVGNDFVEIGFGKPYAAFHEFGTKTMPRRGMLTADPVAGTLGEGDREAITDLVADYLNRAISGT